MNMYRPERILNGAANARDLGGIPAADCRTVKMHRLIRSGGLWNIDDKDVEYLKSIGLKTVVDFRTQPERAERPDRIIEGVEYIVCPMLERETDGITREKPLTDDEDAVNTIKMAKRIMQLGTDGREQMKSLYPLLVTYDYSIEHYRKFFDILLDNEDGALLYHCTMGKDRVGVGTALILSALGVKRENIIADYLITAERCAPGTEKLIQNCRKYTDDEDMLTFIYWLDMVQEDFILAALDTIDAVHGGMDRFLREKMGLDDTKLQKLRDMYLE